MKVDGGLSFKALKEKIGNHYGWNAEEAAANMYMVAMTNLMMAIRIQTVSRGWDPRDFAIIPYGGGGSLYACDLARESGATTVVVPPLPGYASAFGAIRVDVKHEFTHPMHKIEAELDYDDLNRQMDELVRRAKETLSREGLKEENMVIQRFVDVKYFSQSQFFTVDIAPGRISDLTDVTNKFLVAMKAKYGYNLPPGYVPVELVNIRIIAMGVIPKPDLSKVDRKGALNDARKPSRKVWFKDIGFVPTDIYERQLIPVGATFEGPAVVEQPDTTTVLPPRTQCRVDDYGNLIIKVAR
jgi:N-methylhydantoinase A